MSALIIEPLQAWWLGAGNLGERLEIRDGAPSHPPGRLVDAEPLRPGLGRDDAIRAARTTIANRHKHR